MIKYTFSEFADNSVSYLIIIRSETLMILKLPAIIEKGTSVHTNLLQAKSNYNLANYKLFYFSAKTSSLDHKSLTWTNHHININTCMYIGYS